MADAAAEFAAITGASAEASKRFLVQAGGTLELALSNYFDSIPAVPPASIGAPGSPPAVPNASSLASRAQLPPPVDESDSDELYAISLSSSSAASVSLRGASLKTKISDYACEAELVLRYTNDLPNPLEATFTFQQYETTVTGFEAVVGGRKLVGVCKEKGKALDAYDDSIASGGGAYLLQQGEADDVFKLSVGNLPPATDAVLTIKYVMDLESDGETIRFTAPIARTRIDSPAKQLISFDHAVTGLDISVQLAMQSAITSISSPSHTINTARTSDTSARVDLASKEKREFVLLIATADLHKPKILFELPEPNLLEMKADLKASDPAALQLSFFPAIPKEEDAVAEMVFIIDRSGSMAGSRLEQARNALQLFLRSLPEGALFNIIGFGDRFEKLFPSSVPYTDDSLKKASDYAARMKADLGGTDLLPALRDVLATRGQPNFPRQLFLLTDGEVKNTKDVISYVRKNALDSRIFTFGIGAEASKSLVKGAARVGNGTAEFIASGTRIEPVVLRQLRHALQPILTQVRVDWGSLAEDLMPTVGNPFNILPRFLFHGQRMLVYAFLSASAVEKESAGEITLVASSAHKELRFPLQYSTASKSYGTVVHKLAARSAIASLQAADSGISKEAAKAEVVRLSTKYQVSCKSTAFVIVEDRTEATRGSLISQDVNAALDARSAALLDAAPLPQKPGQQQQQRVLGKVDLDAVEKDLAEVDSLVRNIREMGEDMARSLERQSMQLDQISSNVVLASESVPKASVELSAASKRAAPPARAAASSGEEPRSSGFSLLDDLFGAAPAKPVPQPQAPAALPPPPAGPRPAAAMAPQFASAPVAAPAPARMQGNPSSSTFGDLLGLFGSGGSAAAAAPASASVSPKAMKKEEAKKDEDEEEDSDGWNLFMSERADEGKRRRAADGAGTVAQEPKLSAAAGGAAAKPAANARPLDRLVLLQRANGSWALGPELATEAGVALATLQSHARQALFSQGLDESAAGALLATALAVALLEKRFAAARDEWTLIAEKATRYLQKAYPSGGARTVDALLAFARGLVA